MESKRATLPETNSSPLKMDGWNTIRFLLGFSLFSGAKMLVFGECSFWPWLRWLRSLSFWTMAKLGMEVDQVAPWIGKTLGFP